MYKNNKKKTTKQTNISSRNLVVIGAVLTLLYVVGAPVFDLRHAVMSAVGSNFLDTQDNTTTFEAYAYYALYLPVILFSVICAYGLYRQLIKNDKMIAVITALSIVAGALLLYFALDFYFGFKYHFVF